MTRPGFQQSGHDLVVRVRPEVGARVVTVVGEADLLTEHWLAPAMRRALNDCGPAVVLDLTGLSFCSAHALRLLADSASSTSHRGVSVAVVGLSRHGALIWRLTGLPAPLQYRTVAQAVAALRQRHERPHWSLLGRGPIRSITLAGKITRPGARIAG